MAVASGVREIGAGGGYLSMGDLDMGYPRLNVASPPISPCHITQAATYKM